MAKDKVIQITTLIMTIDKTTKTGIIHRTMMINMTMMIKIDNTTIKMITTTKMYKIIITGRFNPDNHK